MGKSKLWTPQEDQILMKVSTNIKSKKWKKTAMQLKKYGYERSDVECRQRFINHLDPNVNKELWGEQELQILYSKYAQYGNRWFLIQKHLPGRTQTKIKNYFYGNIRYLLKIAVKYFLNRSAGFINDLKTETLLKIYQSTQDFQCFCIIRETIKDLRFKIDKNECEKLISHRKQEFQQFIQYLIKKSSDKSQDSKQQNLSQKSSIESSGIIMKLQCLRQPKSKIELPSSNQEEFSESSELQQVKLLVESHYKLYEFYKNSYLNLIQGQAS